jgi:hypothetical protein
MPMVIPLYEIPWTEHAVLSQLGADGVERPIVEEGPLLSVVEKISRIDIQFWRSLTVSLPGRKFWPRRYGDGHFAGLILASGRQRPSES